MEVLGARLARLTQMHVTNWTQAQKDDPVLFSVVKNLRAPIKEFQAALRSLMDG